MSQNIKILQNLGVSEEEARIYLALLGLGGCPASTLAQEIGLKRTTVYPILTSLAEKGFVNMHFQKSKRLYYAEKPAKVAGVLHKKIGQFEDIIPVLESLDKKQAQMLGLRFIETNDELEDFYFALLDEYRGKTYLELGNRAVWDDLGSEFFQTFPEARTLHNVKTNHLMTAGAKITETKGMKVKYLPKKYSFDCVVNIFAERILIISPKFTSVAIVITLPVVASLFETMFEMLWDLVPEKK